MPAAYASLDDIWGVPSFETTPAPVPDNKQYKSRQYQTNFLRRHKQQRMVNVPDGPTADPMVVAELYDTYGIRGILKYLPDQAVRELRELLCQGSGDGPGLMAGIDMQTVVACMLCGFVLLILMDVMGRIRQT
jgi:hypothetical protein